MLPIRPRSRRPVLSALLFVVMVLFGAASCASSEDSAVQTVPPGPPPPPFGPSSAPPTAPAPPGSGGTTAIGTPTTLNLPPALAKEACGLFGRLVADVAFFQMPESLGPAELEAMVTDLESIFTDAEALFAAHPEVRTEALQADLGLLGARLGEIDERLSATGYDWNAFAAANEEWLTATRTEVIDIIGARLIALVTTYCPELQIPGP